MGDLGSPQQLRLRLPALDVGALAWGDEDAPLALCVHGFPDTAWTFRRLAPLLVARGWRVVAPFTRGYAPTDVPSDGSVQVGALAQDVLQLHEALGGDDRALLVGHDWGAVAAATVAVHAPERFAHVVAMAVPPPGTMLAPKAYVAALAAEPATMGRQLKASWYMAYNQVPGLAERRLPSLVEKLWRVWSPGYDAREDLALLAEALPTPAHRRAMVAYYRALTGARRHRDPLYRAEQSAWLRVPEAPVLVLHGLQDGCFYPASAELAARRLPSQSRLELLPGVGHFAQLEDPALVDEHIAAWVGRA